MERKLRSFEAMRPNRHSVMIDEFQTFITVNTEDGRIEIPGDTRFASNGSAVHRFSDNKFWVVQLGEYVTPA